MQQFFRSLKPKNIFDTANLDLEFGKTKSLVDTVSGKTLISFSRTTSATYFDAAGILRTSALNLLSYSEKFEQAPWSTFNVTVTADTVTAPNGILAADTITDVNTVTSSPIVFQAVTMADTTVYCMSCYIKAGTKTLARVGIRSKAGATISASFDLANGTTTLGNALTSSIEAVGNGWYRCSMTANSSTGATSTRAIVWINAGSYTPDGTGTIHVWGAQLEQSSVLSEYIPTAATTSGAPRFDHDPVTGESLGLLIEGARTNQILRSDDFSQSNWTKEFTTVTNNDAVSPDGNTTADKIVEDSSTNFHTVSQYLAGFSLGNVIALSIYAKAAGRTRFIIQTDAGGGAGSADYDLSAVTASSGSGVFSNGSIMSIGNGWYRCSAICTTTAAGPIGIKIILVHPTNGTSYTGDGTSGLYLWGAQMELGSTPSSYIPTTTSSVTRAADVALISGSNFTDWFNPAACSSFWDCKRPYQVPVSDYPLVLDCTNAGRSEIWQSSFLTATLGGIYVLSGGSVQAELYPTVVGSVLNRKLGFAATLDSFSTVVNSGTMQTDTSGNMPTGIDRCTIGYVAGNLQYLFGTIKRLTYWGRRISNTELLRITK